MAAVSAFRRIVNEILQSFPARLLLRRSFVIELVGTILQLLARHAHFEWLCPRNTLAKLYQSTFTRTFRSNDLVPRHKASESSICYTTARKTAPKNQKLRFGVVQRVYTPLELRQLTALAISQRAERYRV